MYHDRGASSCPQTIQTPKAVRVPLASIFLSNRRVNLVATAAVSFSLGLAIGCCALRLEGQQLETPHRAKPAVSALNRGFLPEAYAANPRAIFDIQVMRAWFQSASDLELDKTFQGFPSQFWTEKVNAPLFLCYYFSRRYGADPIAGLRFGAAFLNDLHLPSPPVLAFQAIIDGCFSAKIPPTAQLQQFLPSVSEAEALAIIETVLKFSDGTEEARSALAAELARDCLWAADPAKTKARFANIALRSVLKNGPSSSSLADIFQRKGQAWQSRAALSAFSSFAAFHPREAAKLLESVQAQSPESTGKLAAASRLPFSTVTQAATALDEKELNLFYRGLSGELKANCGRYEEFAVRIPFATIPPAWKNDFLEQMMECTPGAEIDWLSPLSQPDRTAALDALFNSQTHGDPRFSIASQIAHEFYNARFRDGDLNPGMAISVLSSLASKDVDSALSIAAQLPPQIQNEAKQRIMRSALPNLATDDPQRFFTFVAALDPSAIAAALEPIGQRTAYSGFPDPEMLAKGIPNDQARTSFYEGILSSEQSYLSYDQLTRIASQVASSAVQTGLTGKAVAEAGRVFAEYNPSQGKAVIEQMPQGPARSEMQNSFITHWAAVDPTGAADWVQQLSSGADQDAAAAALIQSAPDDLDYGLKLASGISDRSLRIKSLQSIFQTWSNLDAQRFYKSAAENSVNPTDLAEAGAVPPGH